MRIFPDYPVEKSQYPINKKISGYYQIHQNFLSGALLDILFSKGYVFELIKRGLPKSHADLYFGRS